MLTNDFSFYQLLGQPNMVYIQDDSTGDVGTITGRKIYFTDYQGNPVVPSGTTTDYVNWPTGTSTIGINLLTRDMSLNIELVWDLPDELLINSTDSLLINSTDKFLL